MISVVIFINETPIMARSAYRTDKKTKDGKNIYQVDDGSKIEHNYGDGAVPLAIEMLKTIKEPGA